MRVPTLTVVMPNYNDARYLGEAVEAVMGQAFKPTEFIIVDDASTDDSLEVIRSLMVSYPVITVIRNNANMGVILSQNRAIERATGEYIYLASANDRVLPGFFDRSIALLEKHPRAGLCFSDATSIDDNARVERSGLVDGFSYITPENVVGLLKKRHFFVLGGNSAVVRRSALVEAGGLLPELKWLADCFALNVIAFRHGVCHIPEPLAMFRPLEYSKKGLKDAAQREVLANLLRILNSPAYGDVLDDFRRTGIILSNAPQALRVLASHPRYWGLFSLIMVRRAVLNRTKDILRPMAPAAIKRMYHDLHYRDVKA